MGILTVRDVMNVLKTQDPEHVVEVVGRKMYISIGSDIFSIINFDSAQIDVRLDVSRNRFSESDSISNEARSRRETDLQHDRYETERNKETYGRGQRDREEGGRPDYPQCK